MRCSVTPFRGKNRVSRREKGLGDEQPCSDTPFLTEKHVSRTGIRDGGCDSCSDTPFQEKKPVSRARGGKKQTESTPQRTTRYDHTKQNTHTHTRQHYQHTKPHIIPQTPYATPRTTKALPQKRRKSFIEIYQGQLGLEPTGVSNEPETRPYWIPEPTGGQNQLLHRSNYIVPDQPDPSTKHFKGPTRFKLQTVPWTNQFQAPTGFPNRLELPSEGRGAEDGGV